MPAIDSETHKQMLEAEDTYNGCLSMIGLHPCSVKDNYVDELKIVENNLLQRSFVAIGEIGLDFYWDKIHIPQQIDAFTKQIELALKFNLPIVIHSRNALNECIDIVKKYTELRGVFHCFSGTTEQALTIIELNFLLGIGGVVTFKNAGLDKVINKIGISRIVLETDAPYLAPVPHRGKRNESSYLKIIAEKIALLTGTSLEEIANITSKNAESLFRLNQKQ